MNYPEEENNSNYNRTNRNHGAAYYEKNINEEVTGTQQTVGSDDFMKSEERRTDILRNSLERALDALKTKGSDEAFNIANHLYSTLRSEDSKSLVNKYL